MDTDSKETTPLLKVKGRRLRTTTNSSLRRIKTTAVKTTFIKNRSLNRISYRRPRTLDSNSFSSNDVLIEGAAISELPKRNWTAATNKIMDNWKEMGQKPTWRQRIAFYLDNSRAGRYWDLFDTFLNLLFVIIYIWNTSYAQKDGADQPLPHYCLLIELTLASLLLIQWLPRVIIAPDIGDALFTSFSGLTIIATNPPILVNALDYLITGIDFSNTYMSAGFFVYVYPFRFLRLWFSASILLLPVKNSLFNIKTITKKTIQLSMTIIFSILFVSAWIHIATYKQVETDKGTKFPNFFDVFFKTMVSSTSGFSSDITPKDLFSRILILYIMIAGALYLPGKISELLTLLEKRSYYDRSFEPEKSERHVIVCGTFDFNSMFEFLREFFCEDHGMQTMNTVVIILNPEEPSEELQAILNDPAYLNRVQYVKGLPTSYRSLQKVRASKAKACFVLTNKFSPEDDREGDATAVMLALSLKRFSKNMKLYAQVSLPENKPHFDQLARRVICIQELRLGMLAQNVINPGFSTMIYLLTTSLTDTTSNELTSSLEDKPELDWLHEYITGAGHEIYSITFSNYFHGMKFIDIAEVIYKYFGVTLFAINIPSPNSKTSKSSRGTILMNPAFYSITGKETGFILSTSAYDANRISTLGQPGNSLDNHHFLYTEATPAYFNRVESEVSEEPNTVSESPTSTPRKGTLDNKGDKSIPMGRTSTKNSTTESVERKRNLVLQSEDEESGVEHEIVKDDIKEQFSDIEEVPTNLESLSLQERNIAKVVSEMMQENTYYDTLNEVSKLEGHIVICDLSASFPKSMEYFVGSLRASHLEVFYPIVILTVTPPTDGQKHLLEQFGEVYFITGSALNRKTLFTAGVGKAKKGVVLCDDNNSGVNQQRTVDASSLLVVLNMESMAMDPEFFVVVEFIYRENMKLVGAGETINATELYAQALLRPSFMSGHVNAPCMLDPLICQTYYNEYILEVLDRLVFDPSLDKWRKVGDSDTTTVATPLIKDGAKVEPSHIFTKDVPTIFIGRPYFQLFTWLIKEKESIALGLYRTRTYNNRLISYVIVNPDPNNIILESDKVYLIATRF